MSNSVLSNRLIRTLQVQIHPTNQCNPSPAISLSFLPFLMLPKLESPSPAKYHSPSLKAFFLSQTNIVSPSAFSPSLKPLSRSQNHYFSVYMASLLFCKTLPSSFPLSMPDLPLSKPFLSLYPSLLLSEPFHPLVLSKAFLHLSRPLSLSLSILSVS